MKSAREMFEKLGYKFKEIFYVDESNYAYEYSCGGKRFIFQDLDEKGIVTDLVKYVSLDELQAIIQQMKELGWIELDEKQEIKQETNYEHFKDEIIEDGIWNLALVNGKPKRCHNVYCKDCEFKTSRECKKKLEGWLKQPYERPTYKLTQCEYDMLDAIFEKEARFSTVYLIGELKKKGYFENIKCDSKVLVKDILADCEVIE